MNQKNEQKLNKLIEQRLDNLDHTKLEKSTMDEVEYNRTMRELDKFSSYASINEQNRQKKNSEAARIALEKEKLEFEKNKFESEKEMKRLELEIRIKECDYKIAELKQNKWKFGLIYALDLAKNSIASYLGISAHWYDYRACKLESCWSKESRNNLMK